MNKITRTLAALALPTLLLAATATTQAEQAPLSEQEMMKCPMMNDVSKNLTGAEKEKFLQQCKEHCKEMHEKHMQQMNQGQAPANSSPKKAANDASVHQHKK